MSEMNYEQFLKKQNFGSNPKKCFVCGADAKLVKIKQSLDMGQFCKKELLARLWREVSLTMQNKNHAKLLTTNKYYTVSEIAKMFNRHQSCIRMATRILPHSKSQANQAAPTDRSRRAGCGPPACRVGPRPMSGTGH